MPWFCLILFCAAFAATVAVVPWIIAFAHRLGAIDAADGFRKIGHAATPRMGGLAVAAGFAFALLVYRFCGPNLGAQPWSDLPIADPFSVLALSLILAIGIIDDRTGLRAGVKLLGQMMVAVLLFYGGFRIEKLFLFGFNIDLDWFALPVTVFWFIGCMNVWNLIDGMDGLASGVGAIVCTTLMVAATAMLHLEVAYAAAAMSGALAGFLVYNFHPARIFLGDTGSLLLGTVIGMLAIRGSLKSGVTVAILIPLLAMGLPIIDTVLAILRRWVRRMPWSAPDRGHLHHRLIAYGLTTRQASMFLYSFTVLLCAAALASLSLQSDSIALGVGLIGSVGLGAVFAARQEQRHRIIADFKERMAIRRTEQRVSSVVWEGIQRLAHCDNVHSLVDVASRVVAGLECDHYRLRYQRQGLVIVEKTAHLSSQMTDAPEVSTTNERAQLRLVAFDWPDEELLLEVHHNTRDTRPLLVGGPFLNRFVRELLVRLRTACAETHPVQRSSTHELMSA